MNNRRVWTAFAANRKGLFQVPTSESWDQFGVANFFKSRFVDVLAQWPNARETPGPILYSWMLYSCGEPGSLHITLISWPVTVPVMSMLREVA